MTRTTQQVFDAHQAAFEAMSLEQLMADYADDAILLTLEGAFVGKEAIQGFFANAMRTFPNFRVSFDMTSVEGDLFLLQWSGDSDDMDRGSDPPGHSVFFLSTRFPHSCNLYHSLFFILFICYYCVIDSHTPKYTDVQKTLDITPE